MSETIYIACSVLCCILPNLTSDVLLGMDWLYVLNPLIDSYDYSLSLVRGDKIDGVHIMGTNKSCFYTNNWTAPLNVN